MRRAGERSRTAVDRFGSYLRRLRAREVIVLLVLLAVALGVWGFAEIADEVAEGETQHFDTWVLKAVRKPRDPSQLRGPPWLADAARDVTALGSTSVLWLVTLAVLGFLAIGRRWLWVALVIVATGGGTALVHAMKDIYERERPTLFEHLDTVSTYSFPSGHAMLSAVVYITLGALLSRAVARRRLKLYILCVALLLAFLVGASRVFVGVHYPTDVLAGWAGGLAWAALCWLGASYAEWRLRHRDISMTG